MSSIAPYVLVLFNYFVKHSYACPSRTSLIQYILYPLLPLAFCPLPLITFPTQLFFLLNIWYLQLLFAFTECIVNLWYLTKCSNLCSYISVSQFPWIVSHALRYLNLFTCSNASNASNASNTSNGSNACLSINIFNPPSFFDIIKTLVFRPTPPIGA